MVETGNGRAPLRKARTRAAIIEAATVLFAERGYEDTSIHEVAARADTGVGTLYNYFDSKEEILRQVLVRQFEGTEAAFAQVTAARSDPGERLALALEMYATYVRQNRRLLASLFGVSLLGDGDIDAGWRERLVGAFRPLVRDAAAAGCIRSNDLELTTLLLLSTYTFALLRVGVWREAVADDTALVASLHGMLGVGAGPKRALAVH
jgi:AcrR family transcriptional regulator